MRFPLAVISGVMGLVLVVNCTPQKASLPEYPPPGRLIDIGGRKLHLYCPGKGNPTVILVAGGGAFSIDWALVQPHVAENTRVCSYDRAGLGWADPGPADETVEQTIGDLHALLRAAGEKGPYLLVGASIAGIYIQAYQRVYPEDVVGLIFTNSSNRVGLQAKGKGRLIWDLTEDEVRSAFPLPPSVKKEAAPTMKVIRLIACPPTCRRFACGLTCVSGSIGIRRRQVRTLFCRGGKSSCWSSQRQTRAGDRRSESFL
jgi:pimeloyl-ACP methyl ester carboxylesterase